MKTLRILLAALFALAPIASASVLDRVLNSPRVKDNGDIRLSDDVKIGRFRSGKYTATPDAVQVQGVTNTGAAGVPAGFTGSLRNDALAGLGPWQAPNVFRATDDFNAGAFNFNPDPTGNPYGYRGSSAFAIENTMGGSNATGAKYSSLVRTFFDGKTADLNVNRNYVGHSSQLVVNSPDTPTSGVAGCGGTDGCGGFFAYHPYAVAKPGATNLLELAGMENDVGGFAGSSMSIRRGFSAISFLAVQGSKLDAAFSVGSGSGGVSWKTGLVFTDKNGGPAVDPAGSLISVVNQPGQILTTAWAFDFQNAAFNTGIIRSPGILLTNDIFQMNSANSRIVLGSASAAGNAILDLSSSGTGNGADVRLNSVGGTSTLGQGQLQITAGNVALAGPAGTCTHTPGTSAETVSCSSDERLKSDIVDADAALPTLQTMRVREFTVKASGERRTGVIAQEMQATHPEMVHAGEDGLLQVDIPSPWLLTKAVQELRADNDNLRIELRIAEGLSALGLIALAFRRRLILSWFHGHL